MRVSNCDTINDGTPRILTYDEMHGSFYVTPDTDEVVLECCSSLDVYGFNGDPAELSFNKIREY